jgi:hypothetical protein
MWGKLGRLIGLALVGLSLYLWIEVLGGFSFWRGLYALAVILGVVLVAGLPNRPAWCKAVKILVLAAGAIRVIGSMLPIETAGEWMASILIGAVFCLIGYLVLFETFLA